MSSQTPSKETPILVEFVSASGLKQVSLSDKDVAQKSKKAIDTAMNCIKQIVSQVSRAVDSEVFRPDHVSVTFGIKFDAEAGAFIAKTGMEASLNVQLKWEGGRDAQPNTSSESS